MPRPRSLKSLLALATLAALSLSLAVFPHGCGSRGRQEEYRLEVTLGKTRAPDLVRLMGPPMERSFGHLGQPTERLHFNVPFDRVIFVDIAGPDNSHSQKTVRGKSVLSFYFVDGLLSSVD
ncbi:MAG: hypothetical protein LBU69_05255 [Deltaproteobacteria bacterium]|jgi:hypothetical protein|nr:hypothetical protein [Deltaproteobacteria bacterium]